MTANMPTDYLPLNYCTSCGRDFAGLTYFDRHRIGVLEYDFSLERPDGRRCMDEEELREVGLRPLSEDELRVTKRHEHRAGFGVEMWFDPTFTEAARRHRGAFPYRQDASEGLRGTSEGVAA
jgi:hypothetical protein